MSADALNAARLEASLRLQGETDNEKKGPDLTTMVCGLLLALSFLKYVYQPLEWLALGSVVIGFPKVLLRAIASIKALTLNINILVLLAGTLVWIVIFLIPQSKMVGFTTVVYFPKKITALVSLYGKNVHVWHKTECPVCYVCFLFIPCSVWYCCFKRFLGGWCHHLLILHCSMAWDKSNSQGLGHH